MDVSILWLSLSWMYGGCNKDDMNPMARLTEKGEGDEQEGTHTIYSGIKAKTSTVRR